MHKALLTLLIFSMGVAHSTPFYSGFIRENDGTYTSIEYPGAVSTVIDSANSAGEITGSYYDGLATRGFLRHADGTYEPFSHPDAQGYTLLTGVNDTGTATGLGFNSTSLFFSLIRQADGQVEQFGVPGAASTIATDIDEAGNIVGIYIDGTGARHGFRRRVSDGGFDTIDIPGFAGTFVYGANDLGEVVAAGQAAPFLLRPGEDPLALDGVYFNAADVDNSGNIVGTYSDQGYRGRVYNYRTQSVLIGNIFFPSGTGYHEPIVRETWATAYQEQSGRTYGFYSWIPNPVPEPGTLLSTGAALALGAAVSWRRRKKGRSYNTAMKTLAIVLSLVLSSPAIVPAAESARSAIIADNARAASAEPQPFTEDEARELAQREEKPGKEVAGGALSNLHLTYIVIALATAVIVLIAVH